MSSQNARTPDDLYLALDRTYHFTLDVAASEADRKCERWLEGPCVHEGVGHSFGLTWCERCNCGLCSDWLEHVCWLNPPYENIAQWVAKCEAAARAGATIVMLVYSGTGVSWYRAAEGSAREKWEVDGRVQFEPAPGDEPFKNGNNRDSVLFIWRPPDGSYGPIAHRRFSYERAKKPRSSSRKAAGVAAESIECSPAAQED